MPRSSRTLLASVVASSLVAAGLAAAGPAPAASATTCRPTPALLSRTPTTTALPGGATMKVYDTGATSNPEKAVRLVVVRVPAGSGLRPHVVRAGGLNTSRTLSTQVAAAASVVAGVNGAVFDPSRGALPRQVQMDHGIVRKARYDQDNVITVAPDGTSSPDHLWLRGTVAAAGHSWKVTGLNWQSVYGSGITVYTTSWGRHSRPYGVADVVVTDGVVSAVRTGSARGQAVAGGQKILTANGTLGSALAHLKKGTKVAVGYHAESDAKHPVREAVGRGGRYLLHGVQQGGGCGTRDETLRPRTAVGWTSSGDLLLVTVSGRDVRNGVLYGGATVHQMPDYLAKLGAYEATGLDGGGSTTMVVRRSAGGAPVRVDRGASTTQRAVPNAFVLS